MQYKTIVSIESKEHGVKKWEHKDIQRQTVEFTINHQKTKLTISRLMSCFHQLSGRRLSASILYHFFFFQCQFVHHPYTNLYLLFLPDSFSRSKFVAIGFVSFSELMYSIVYKSFEVSSQEMFMQVYKSLQFLREKKRFAWVGLEPKT